jgi:hypothetical protein
VDAWKPSLFGVKEHKSSHYPLEGKHISVPCAKCHTPAGAETLYKVKFAACLDCHKDEHDGQFADPPYKNRCEACHAVQDYHRSTYTIAMHQKSKFPLTGAHTAVACDECHKPAITHRTDKILPFRFTDQTCTACHQDPHHGEFNDRMVRKRPNGTPFGCEACHSTTSWIDVNGFDHAKTKFPLTGVHRTVACGQCHKALPGQHQIQFKGTPLDCEPCHKEPHGGQFKTRTGNTPCGECHDTQRWVPSTFDHDKRTPFPLSGGHTNVPCDKCHTATKLIEANPVLFYKPTPRKCDECHGSNVPVPKSKICTAKSEIQATEEKKKATNVS